MACKCRICGSNEVENQGDICELCAIGVDPYATGFGTVQTVQTTQIHTRDDVVENTVYVPRNSNKRLMLGNGSQVADKNSYVVSQPQSSTSPVQVYSAGHVPQAVSSVSPTYSAPVQAAPVAANQSLAAGIAKNISVDKENEGTIAKWFRAFFQGIPFSTEKEVTMFQVFPDYTGTTLNSMGNACDQVYIYGKLKRGLINDNNDVEVYGKRDANNNIIASTVRNRASGTLITPTNCMSATAVRLITVLTLMLIVGVIMGLGPYGIVSVAILIFAIFNIKMVFKWVGKFFRWIGRGIKKLFL